MGMGILKNCKHKIGHRGGSQWAACQQMKNLEMAQLFHLKNTKEICQKFKFYFFPF